MSEWWQQIGLVLVGAVIGIFPTVGIERMRWRREDMRAARDERRGAYADFLVRLSGLEHDTVQLAREIFRRGSTPLTAEVLRHPGAVEDEVVREIVRERNAVAELMITSYETVKLVGTDESSRTAKILIDYYNEMLELARNGRFDPDPAWADVREKFGAARDAFRYRARAEVLGPDAKHA